MYVDPNTGGILFQVIAGMFVFLSGMMLIFSSKIKQVWACYKRGKSPESISEDQKDPNEIQ